MKRRVFLKTTGLVGLFAGVGLKTISARIPPHPWNQYDFGSSPKITNRLYQGPFSAYGNDANTPGAEAIMATSPSKLAISNFGMATQ